MNKELYLSMLTGIG